MEDDNLSLKLQEIQKLQEELLQKKNEVRAEGVAKVQALIDQLDIDVSELRFKSQSQVKPVVRKSGMVAPKYRGPNGETWTGRGRQPKWLAALIAEGHALEEFLI